MESVSIANLIETFGSLSPAERGVITLVLLTLVLTVAVIALLRFKSVKAWLDSRLRVALGTLGSVATVIVVSVTILLIWGKADQFGVLVGKELSAEAVIQTMLTLSIMITTYGGAKFIEQSVEHLADDQSTIDRHSEQVLIRFAQVAAFIIGLLSILSVWNVNIGNLLIGAGFLSVIVGFAARQTLSSSLAGFTLMLSQPFKIGDWVEIDGKRGRVMKITIVNTRLRSHTGEYIVIPNETITETDVTNLSDMGRLQLHTDVGVDYDADLDHAMDVVETATRDVKAVMDTPGPSVHPEEFGDSAITLRVYYWIDNPSETRRRRAKADVITAIKEAFDEEGLDIPFPQRTLSSRPDGTEADAERAADNDFAADAPDA